MATATEELNLILPNCIEFKLKESRVTRGHRLGQKGSRLIALFSKWKTGSQAVR